MSSEEGIVLTIKAPKLLCAFIEEAETHLGIDPCVLLDLIFSLTLSQNIGNEKFDLFDSIVEDTFPADGDEYQKLFGSFDLAIDAIMPFMFASGLISAETGDPMVVCKEYKQGVILCGLSEEAKDIAVITPDHIVKTQKEYYSFRG